MSLAILCWLKGLLVPKGSFGQGQNAKLTEIIALIIISLLLSLGLYWSLIFFLIFLKTGQLTNISTTIALYSRLEVPSMTICSLSHLSFKYNIVEAFNNDRLKITLIYKTANKNYYNFNPLIRQCSWEKQDLNHIDQCLCIDMWKQTFYERRKNIIYKYPFFLFHRSTADGFDVDSISISLKYLKPILNNKETINNNSDFFDLKSTDYNDWYKKSNYAAYENFILSDILKIGIYDQPMIIASQHSDSIEPSWFYSNIGNTAQVSLKLLKNYVFDVEKFYFYIIKGYVSRQENEYEIVVSQKNNRNYIYKKRNRCKIPYWVRIVNRSNDLSDRSSNSYRRCFKFDKELENKFEISSFTKFHVTFRDFSVTEVFRLSGASLIASFLTLAVVCFSAFNKQLIYELLFPYYEDRNTRMTVTTLATFLSFGYVRKYNED